MGQNNSLFGTSNTGNVVLQNFIQEQWQVMIPQRPIKKEYGVIQTLRNQHTGQLIQKYQLLLESEKEIKTYLDSFIYRLKEQFIVNTLYIQKHSKGFCSHQEKISVYLPAILLRLEQICQVPFPFSICLLRSSIIGYHKLYDSLGYFDVEENQICIDYSGSVKVWVNKNLSSNTPFLLEQHVRLNCLPKKATKRTDLTQQCSQKKQYIKYDKNENWMVINVLEMVLKSFEYSSETINLIDMLESRIQSAKLKSLIVSRKRMNQSQQSLYSVSKNSKSQPLTFEEIIEIINQFTINCPIEIPQNLDFIVQLMCRNKKTEIASLIGTKKSQLDNFSINDFSRSNYTPGTTKTQVSQKSCKYKEPKTERNNVNSSCMPVVDSHHNGSDLRFSQVSGTESHKKIKTSLKQKLSKISYSSSSSNQKQKLCLNNLFLPLKNNSNYHHSQHSQAVQCGRKDNRFHSVSEVQYESSNNASKSSQNHSHVQSMSNKFSIPKIRQTNHKPNSENMFSFQDSAYKFKNSNNYQQSKQYLSMNHVLKNCVSSKNQILNKVDCWTMTDNVLPSLQEYSMKDIKFRQQAPFGKRSQNNLQIQIYGDQRQRIHEQSKLHDSLLFGNRYGIGNGYSLRQQTFHNTIQHRSQDSNSPSEYNSLKNSLHSQHQVEKQLILQKLLSNDEMLPQIQQIQQTRKTLEQSEKNQSYQYSHTSEVKPSQVNKKLNDSKISNVQKQKGSLVQKNREQLPTDNNLLKSKSMSNYYEEQLAQSQQREDLSHYNLQVLGKGQRQCNEGRDTKRSQDEQQLESLYSVNHNKKVNFDCKSQASSVIFDKLSQVSRHIDFGISQNNRLITPSQISMILDKKFCNDLDQYASAVNNQSYEDNAGQQYSVVQNTDSLFNLKKRFKKKMFCCESKAAPDNQSSCSAMFSGQKKFKKPPANGTSDSKKGLVTSLDLKQNKKTNQAYFHEQIPQIDENMEDSKHTINSRKVQEENKVKNSHSEMSLSSQNLAMQLGQRVNENDLTVPCVELEQIVNGLKKQQNQQNRYIGPGPMEIDRTIVDDFLKQTKKSEKQIKRSHLGAHNRIPQMSKPFQKN